MIYIWVAIVIILAIIELKTSSLIPIWFSISGVLSVVISIFVDSYVNRLLVFALGGLMFLTIFRPIFLKKKNK